MLYKAIVVKCNIAPSEYWLMSPAECWLIIDAHTPQKTYGNLSQTEFDEMAEFRQSLLDQGYELA
jgi:hypothetical protein